MIRSVLLDLGGVLYVGDTALSGAVTAVSRLREAGLPVRFLTNTTRKPRAAMLERLRQLDVPADTSELFTPAAAARAMLERAGLRPHLLVHPDLEEDFAGLTGGNGTAVVVGDVGRSLDYAQLNAAFRALLDADAFLALAANRAFEEADGQLSLDAGPFVAALEYAAEREATVVGKPARAFFEAAVESLGCAPGETVMVGDDVEADVHGAQAAGLAGILVRQGKYRAGAEERIDPKPAAVATDLAEAMDWILARAE